MVRVRFDGWAPMYDEWMSVDLNEHGDVNDEGGGGGGSGGGESARTATFGTHSNMLRRRVDPKVVGSISGKRYNRVMSL
jgi:hypothetical protein